MAGALPVLATQAVASGLIGKGIYDNVQDNARQDRLLGAQKITDNLLLNNVGNQSLPTPNFKPVPSFDQNTGAMTPGTSAPAPSPTVGMSALDQLRMQMNASPQMQAALQSMKPQYQAVPDIGLVNTNASGGPKVAIATPQKPGPLPGNDIQDYTLAKSQGYQGTFADWKKEQAQNGRAPEKPDVQAVFDRQLGKTRYASKAEIAANPTNFTEPPPQQPGYEPDPNKPGSVKPIAGSAQEAEAKAKQQSDELAYRNANDALEHLATSAQDLRDDPNLTRVTGNFKGSPYVPNGQQATNTQAKIENLLSQVTIQAMQAARQGSQSGATGFGALSEKELGVLQDEVANLRNQRQDTPQYQKQLDVVINHARQMQGNLRSARGQGGAAAPPPGALAMLRANPSLAAQYDAKYGNGAAAKVLGSNG